ASVENHKAAKAVVKTSVADSSVGLQACYQAFLSRSPQIDEGAVVVNWLVDETGHIQSPKLMKTDLNDSDFTTCILEKVRGSVVTPPSTKHATLVAHTLNFRRKDASSLSF